MFTRLLSGIVSLVMSLATLNCPTLSGGTNPTSSGDPDTPTPTGTTDPTTIPTTIPDCDSTQTRLKRYLLDYGYNENAAAAILGNLAAESNISVYSIEDSSVTVNSSFRAWNNGAKTYRGGFGIAQWDYAARVRKLQEYADSIGKPVASEEAQFGYLVKELSNDYNMPPSVMNAKSLEDATWVMHRSFENPFSVRCTQSNPCTTTRFQCPGSGYPCRNNDSGRGIKYWNEYNTRGDSSHEKVSYDYLINNKTRFWAAWKSLENRINKANEKKNLSLASCNESSSQTGDGQTTGDDQPTSTDPYPTTGDEPADPSPTAATSGSVGIQNVGGYYVQTQGNYANRRWRKNDNSGTPYIKESGCSLIAVANALKALNRTVDPNTLIDWSVNNVTSAGWGQSVGPISNHFNLHLSGFLWDSVSTNSATKETKLRSALASGHPVILSGARNDVSAYNGIDCNSSANKSAGKCVFNKNGHFIVIIGITADGKAVVANPANGPNGNYPLSEILRTSKYAKEAY